MKTSRIASNTEVFPNARDMFIEGSRTAVLLLHGWTGWTGRVAPLAKALGDAGHTVRVPRLPGHGTSLPDFLSASWHDWHRKAIDEFLDLRSRCGTVYVAGASMGGLLTLMIAAQFEVPRVAVLAPALMMRNRYVPLAPLLKRVIPTIRTDWKPENDPDPDSGPIGAEYKSRNYVSAIAELYGARQHARKVLPRVRSATLAIASTADETVPPDVLQYLEKKIGSGELKTVLLNESGHQMVQGVEGETVCQAVLDWFAHER